MAKQVKAADIRAMSDDQLKKRIGELQKEQFNLRFQRTSGQLENTAAVRAARREVATVKTILSERRLGVAVEAAAPKKAAKPAAKKTVTKKKKA